MEDILLASLPVSFGQLFLSCLFYPKVFIYFPIRSMDILPSQVDYVLYTWENFHQTYSL